MAWRPRLPRDLRTFGDANRPAGQGADPRPHAPAPNSRARGLPRGIPREPPVVAFIEDLDDAGVDASQQDQLLLDDLLVHLKVGELDRVSRAFGRLAKRLHYDGFRREVDERV